MKSQTSKIAVATRNVEFDIARAIAVFLMIFQHLWLVVLSGFANNPLLDFFIFLSGTFLVAPVFLFIMGANIVASRKNKAPQLFVRGLKFLVVGYALSFFKFFLPLFLLQKFGLIVDLENIIYKIPLLGYLLEFDILQIAGFALITIALLKKLKIKTDIYLIIAFIVALISPFLSSFFGTEKYIIFPFFPWIFYPLLGYYFGNALQKTENKRHFYLDCLRKIIPVFFLGIVFLFFGSGADFSYSHHGTGLCFLFASIIVVWLAFWALNYQKLKTKTINILTFFSKKVTIIYIVQWLVIAWTAILLNIK